MLWLEKDVQILDNADKILDAVLSDDVAVLSEYVADEEQANKFFLLNQLCPTILNDCHSLLGLAAFFGASEIVDYLLSIGADVKQNDERQTSAIFFAAAGGNLTIFKKLCDIDKSVSNEEGVTPCMFAAKMGKIDIIKYIWSRNKSEITMEDASGMQAVHYAAKYGHVGVVDFLLSQGVKVDEKDSCNFTPLIYAAECGSTELVEYLISKKAKVNEKTRYGMTALCLAARNGSLAVVKTLIDNGAFYIAKNNASPLVEACGSGHLDVVKYLVEKGAKINTTHKDGFFPLMAAAKEDRIEVFKYLLSKGAKIDMDADDYNILEYACINNACAIVNYILDNNLISLDDISKKTIMRCYDNYAIDALFLLIKNGVDVLDLLEINGEVFRGFFYPSFKQSSLIELMNEYERLGKTKFGDLLKIATEMRDMDLLLFLKENRNFDFTVFNTSEEKIEEFVSKKVPFEILFQKEELLKNQECRDMITRIVIKQNNIGWFEAALMHGIVIPTKNLEEIGILFYAFIKNKEELFNKLMDIGVNVQAGVKDMVYGSGGYRDDCISLIIGEFRIMTPTQFQLNAFKRIIMSCTNMFAGINSPFSNILTVDNPDVVNIVKENVKLTQKIVENNILLQKCISSNSVEYFEWILSFKPDIFGKNGCGRYRSSPFTIDPDEDFFGISRNPFKVIRCCYDIEKKRFFMEKLIEAYDYSEKNVPIDLYIALFQFNDIKILEKARDHGVSFNSKYAIDVLGYNYGTVDKKIIDFYYENGVSKKDLNKRSALISYEFKKNVKRQDIQEVMMLNDQEITEADEIIESSIVHGNYVYATYLVQCGVKTRLFGHYLSDDVDQTFLFYYSARHIYCLYFVNVALENGCTFVNATRNSLVYKLLKLGRKNLFYIFTKHGYKIKEGKSNISCKKCIELGQKCGIPEDYIRSVYQ